MHTGLGLCFQSLDNQLDDAEVYRQELAIAAAAEDDGFDSIWTPEHHFTDYMMTPNVTQFLSWVAGQTSHIRLGIGLYQHAHRTQSFESVVVSRQPLQ